MRQNKAVFITKNRHFFNHWTAGISKTKHFGNLVKGFAGGVINCGAQALKFAHAFNNQNLAVPAGDQ